VNERLGRQPVCASAQSKTLGHPWFGLADVSRRINVACVGDSITRGSRPGAKEPSSYPAYLLRLLGTYFVVDS
jgi:hypothetical protein